jgi:hypothetical protein
VSTMGRSLLQCARGCRFNSERSSPRRSNRQLFHRAIAASLDHSASN